MLSNEHDRQTLTHALYRAYWVENLRVNEEAVVQAVFAKALPGTSHVVCGSAAVITCLLI